MRYTGNKWYNSFTSVENNKKPDNDPYVEMRLVKVTYENGEIIEIRINGTKASITAYYLNKTFNLSSIEDEEKNKEILVRGVKVEFLDN